MFNVDLLYPIPYMAELYHEPHFETENWIVRTFEITKDNWYAIVRDGILPGKYVSLNSKRQNNSWDNTCMMSDTPMERFTNQEFINKAYGNVLIAGLGIGMVPAAIADKDDVESITILEIDQEIIDLIEPLIRKYVPNQHKIAIIQADAYKYPKSYNGNKYDSIWLDIWPELPNTKEDHAMFKKLFNLYKPIMVKPNFDGWGYSYASYATSCGYELNPIETKAFTKYLNDMNIEQLINKSHKLSTVTVDNQILDL